MRFCNHCIDPACSPRIFVITLAVLLAGAGTLPAAAEPPAQDDEYLARARELLSRVPLIDGHNDLAHTIVLNHDAEPGRVDLK